MNQDNHLIGYGSFSHQKAQGAEKARGTGVGMASVLMIVMVLAFTTFGILSLVSASADARLSQKSEEVTAAYYEAEGQIQEQIANLDAVLLSDPSGFREGEIIQLAENTGENTQLQVSLQITDSSEQSRYRILQHRLVHTNSWIPDDGLNVWDGGE